MNLFISKNPTPLELGRYSATIITLANFFCLVGIKYVFYPAISWFFMLGISVVIFAVSYFLILEVLERFIYRRVQLIHKTIHRQKAPKDAPNEKLNLQNRILDDVEEEVILWANTQKKEIDDLRKLEKYRRDFIGNISHELKTPIFNMQGYLYTLIEGGLYDEKINLAYLKKSTSNLERLSLIVEDLDMISQFESQRIILEHSKFDIRSLCLELFQHLEMTAKEKGITFFINEDTEQPFYVWADKERIRQVLINLMTNSVKYGKKGGQTKVSFYKVDKLSSLIEVSDNGLGIEEQHLSRLFERFYRVSTSRSRNEGGTGLGLAIVKHMIEAHNQTINVRSTPDIGSTFGFTLENPK